ncbi:hypothetical protein [Aeromonas salmonicida]
MNLKFITITSMLLFSSFSYADSCSISSDVWDLSSPVERNIDGPQHNIPLGVFGGMTNEVHNSGIFRDCTSGTTGKNTTYYLKYNGVLGPEINHYSGSEYIVYGLPGVPGIGVSVDMKDPNRNWVSMAEQDKVLISYNGPTVGFKSRIQFHIVGELKPGKYNLPRKKVGMVIGDRHGGSSPYTPELNIYLPEIKIIINTRGCQLDVPSHVSLNDDLSEATPFSIGVSQCTGAVNIYTRFSDVTDPEIIKDHVKNTGTAQGYSLKIETEDGKPIQLIPVGTNAKDGELSFGKVNEGGSISKIFRARISEEQSKKVPGTLEYGVIVGVAYR